MFSNFHISIAFFVSAYIYAEGQICSGTKLGNEFGYKSLQSAKDACAIEDKCECIYDVYCNGGFYYLSTGQPTASPDSLHPDYLHCSWATGSLIWTFEQRH